MTDKYKLLIVVESIKDASELIHNCGIRHLNLGGTKATSQTRNISKAVNITEEETAILKDLIADGVDVEIQMVPDDAAVKVEKVL